MRVGLDIGGTKTEAVAIDSAGTIVTRLRLATDWGSDGVVRTVLAAVHAIAAEVADAAPIASVGIGIPGQIEPRSGRVLHAVNLGIAELDLADAVAAELGVSVRVENDVKAAAAGASAMRSAASGSPRGSVGEASGLMAYLNLGTGVAAGIVGARGLWRGARGVAGEIGHLSIDPNGPLCRCGQRGCIETFAGGGAIMQRWGRPGVLPILDLFDSADGGDPHARMLRGDLARGVAAAVRALVLTADVDVVVLGGGITALGPRLRADISAELAADGDASAFIRSLRLDERIEMLPTGSPAAALGAALIGARGVLGHG
ncbi:MAG: ROK family protein [Microbacterium sp.]